jgi:hypothetical protein
MGHVVCDDVGNGDNGNNNAGNEADEGDGGDAGGEGGEGSWQRMWRRWQWQQGRRRWRRLHIARIIESVIFQFKKMGTKEWKRSHKSKRVFYIVTFHNNGRSQKL